MRYSRLRLTRLGRSARSVLFVCGAFALGHSAGSEAESVAPDSGVTGNFPVSRFQAEPPTVVRPVVDTPMLKAFDLTDSAIALSPYPLNRVDTRLVREFVWSSHHLRVEPDWGTNRLTWTHEGGAFTTEVGQNLALILTERGPLCEVKAGLVGSGLQWEVLAPAGVEFQGG